MPPEEDTNLLDFVNLFAKKELETAIVHLTNSEATCVELNFKLGTIKIYSDGKVELSQGLTVDEAALLFWKKIAFFGSNSAHCVWAEQLNAAESVIGRRDKEIIKYKEQIQKLEEDIKKLSFKDSPTTMDRFDLED